MLEWGRVEEHKAAAQGHIRIFAIFSVSEEQEYSFGLCERGDLQLELSSHAWR